MALLHLINCTYICVLYSRPCFFCSHQCNPINKYHSLNVTFKCIFYVVIHIFFGKKYIYYECEQLVIEGVNFDKGTAKQRLLCETKKKDNTLIRNIIKIILCNVDNYVIIWNAYRVKIISILCCKLHNYWGRAIWLWCIY